MYVAMGWNWLYIVGINLFQREKKIKQERMRRIEIKIKIRKRLKNQGVSLGFWRGENIYCLNWKGRGEGGGESKFPLWLRMRSEWSLPANQSVCPDITHKSCRYYNDIAFCKFVPRYYLSLYNCVNLWLQATKIETMCNRLILNR